MSLRLLPGDAAPGLKLARVFNRADFGPVVFDRPSILVLWNAGCAGCLPAIGKLAEFAGPRGVPVYGVAVLVRDVEATAAAAAQGSDAAVLALEERPDDTSGLSRGAVTREWLEASGRDGVPSTYVIDGDGVLAWIGDPEDAKAVVASVLDGTWNVQAARAAWLDAIGDDGLRRRLLREATDAMVAGRLDDAAGYIAELEGIAPEVSGDEQFACLKLDVLSRMNDRQAEAEAHYLNAARRFRGDAAVQTKLALNALHAMPGNMAVARVAHEGLAEVVNAEDWAGRPLEMRFAAAVLLLDAATRLGREAEAGAASEQAERLLLSPELSERTRRWGRSEIDRLRQDVPQSRAGAQ
ncbi:peroxiredoxin family protein [Ancylobacter oerskovii]|uniref:Peroxiredoxin family protein n=1 Tax=Ancylobacter oerskovii TaxID=459519 RepID=A0ABW4Z5E6_9HYPH|nr:hypothetical protein [Ancylobacter oerskovii]MBS7545537.1 hypothetical protein [Ancylobacter oerskovii]